MSPPLIKQKAMLHNTISFPHPVAMKEGFAVGWARENEVLVAVGRPGRRLRGGKKRGRGGLTTRGVGRQREARPAGEEPQPRQTRTAKKIPSNSHPSSRGTPPCARTSRIGCSSSSSHRSTTRSWIPCARRLRSREARPMWLWSRGKWRSGTVIYFMAKWRP